MHRVRKVERYRARCEALDLTAWREDIDLVIVEVKAQAFHELLVVAALRIPVHQVAQPLLRLGSRSSGRSLAPTA